MTSEFAIIAEYSIISKVMQFLTPSFLLSATKTQINSIYKYLNRISEYLSGNWLFFQMDYLFMFYNLLNSELITKNVNFRLILLLVKKILNEYF
jgi:hypothetical protein